MNEVKYKTLTRKMFIHKMHKYLPVKALALDRSEMTLKLNNFLSALKSCFMSIEK